MDTVAEKVFIRFLKRFHFTQYFSTTAHFIWICWNYVFYDSHWAWLGLGNILNWFPVLMNSWLSVKSLQRRQRIRIIFQQFPQCRSPPPPCPPPSARPYSSWSSRHISRLGEMKELRDRMQVRDYTSITSADAWSIVISSAFSKINSNYFYI